MPFSTYAELQTSILNWLGRPGDALLLPAVPDWIALFEAEARDRLRSRFAEQLDVQLGGTGGVYQLPDDFWAMRRVNAGGTNLHYEPGWVLDEYGDHGGRALRYTIEALQLRLQPPPDSDMVVTIDYMSGIPALSSSVTKNWLLEQAPDLYLAGSLLCAEAYTGNDERIQLWRAQREAGFERIREASIRALMGGAPLQIIPYGDTP